MEENFDDIRPYSNKEFPEVMKRLASNKLVGKSARIFIIPHCVKPFCTLFEWIMGILARRYLMRLKSIEEFQKRIIIDLLLRNIIRYTISELTSSGLEDLDPEGSYLFISNHRDIVLDSALINYFISKYGHPTCQIAFGENLLANELVSDLIRINKSFIVRRNLHPREQLRASVHLSRYIYQTLITNHESMWIAQRAGRAKDGDDKTNPAILKMIYLSQRKSGKTFAEYMKELKIVPVAISYERDPLDRMKAWELYRTEKKGVYKKGKMEDLLHMYAGLKRRKGRVHLAFDKPLDADFANDKESARAIDESIHRNFRLWPNNYIAYDKIHNSVKYIDKYTHEEKKKFLHRFRVLPSGVRSFALAAYAKAVENYELLPS